MFTAEAKQCFRCGKTKSLDEFYKHPQMADGHLGKCKDCTKADAAQNTAKRKLEPAWVEKERARGREKFHRLYSSGRKWIAPEAPPDVKKAATVAVNNAVRDGRLQKPGRCSECQQKRPSRHIHAHHEDYSKPLDVVWLCAKCHREVHLTATR